MKKLVLIATLSITTSICGVQAMFSSLPKDSVMELSAMMEVKGYERGSSVYSVSY